MHKKSEVLPFCPPTHTHTLLYQICLRCLSRLFTHYSSHSNLWEDLCTGLIVVYDMKQIFFQLLIIPQLLKK